MTPQDNFKKDLLKLFCGTTIYAGSEVKHILRVFFEFSYKECGECRLTKNKAFFSRRNKYGVLEEEYLICNDCCEKNYDKDIAKERFKSVK